MVQVTPFSEARQGIAGFGASWDRMTTLHPSGLFPCDFETRAADSRDLVVVSGGGHSLSKYCVTNARVIASPRPESRRMSSADIAEKSVG